MGSASATEDLTAIRNRLRAFANERDWDQFHNPKNLAMALAGEVGELLEILQWLTPDEASAVMHEPAKAEAVSDELADCLYYLVRIADQLDVDLGDALAAKMEKNAAKYPAAASRGSARKYTDL